MKNPSLIHSNSHQKEYLTLQQPVGDHRQHSIPPFDLILLLRGRNISKDAGLLALLREDLVCAAFSRRCDDGGAGVNLRVTANLLAVLPPHGPPVSGRH